MKKAILVLAFLILLSFGLAYADDAQRQVTDAIATGTSTTVTEIKSTAGKVYSVSMVATLGAGWVCLYDSTSSTVTGLEPKIELSAATQYNMASQDFEQGLEFYKGIYAQRCHSSVIVSYY